MLLFTTGPTNFKIENANAITHTSPLSSYLEKDPVIVTEFYFPFYLWLLSFCYIIRTLIFFLREVLTFYIMKLSYLIYLIILYIEYSITFDLSSDFEFWKVTYD